MKKFLLLFIAALLIIPGVALAQTDSLSRSQINRIANSVVLVLVLDKDGNPFASGSGTIVSPTGEIYTNRHVVEDGADFAILTLSDMGEPAQLAYFATPTLVHPDVDFAELQIDRDASGNPIDPNSLDLSYIAVSNVLPEIGDRVFVFGYPTLGDAHLVMTSGSITSVQNDTLDGQRIPFWYQTDAQFSPGNSGGLAVDLDGRLIGIPTEVHSEERTLGRLGSLLTASVIRVALQSDLSQAQPTQSAVPTRQPVIKGTPSAPLATQESSEQALSIKITSVEHNITNNDQLGMMVHTSADATGYQGVPLRAAVFAFWDDTSPMPANNRAATDERTTDGQLTIQQVVTPGYDDTVWDDMWFFIPYTNLPEGRLGTFPAYLEAQLGVDGGGFIAFSDDEAFDYTYPDKQLIVDLTSIEHNVVIDNQTGMKVHAHIRVIGYQGQDLLVGLFVYWKDGTPIPGDEAPTDNRTTSGYLTQQTTLTPSYPDSQWDDFWLFLPYDYFPTGLNGDQDAFAEVEIGEASQPFASWSLDEDFTLNYPTNDRS